MESETAKRLSAMSDEGAFERLATAVLREADPRYAALSHPGVNAAGKTVKSPLDGIAFILGANPPHLVAVHHTTTKVTGLADKWLLDPKTVKPRKEKPTAPSGDLLKTAKIVADERQREPNLLATLALTTNQEPSQDLFRNVHAAGREHTIEVDIWPRSRIAHFLDSPRGQWLRYSFFGIQQEHVSKELLTKLSHDSLRISQPPGDAPEVWIERSVDTALSQARRDVVFLIADPGLGKSVASYKQLMQHVERGGYGLVVHYDLIGKSLTTVQALDLALRQLHPHLVPDAGSDALLLCEPSLPFLIVVEDINRSGQPSELLERILTWTQSDSKDENDRSRWRIICPIWPQSVLPLKDVFRKRVEGLALPCLLMTTSESRAAVRKRVSLRNRKISDMDADAIAEALGHDPLLIGLHDFEQKPDAQGVISHFVEGCLARTVALANYTTADYRMGLNAFAQEMLSRRKLDPTWTEIADWFGSADTVTCILRILVRQGEIIRLPAASGNDRISFRHDRVRDFLLTSALARHVRERKLDEDLLSDPYFAEMLGIVATGPDVPHVFIVQLEEANPLALFYAFSRVPQTDEPTDGPIVDAILRWLKSSNGQSPRHQRLRRYALRVLAQIDSPRVREIVACFREQGWDAWAARFRNGDLAGGIELCVHLDPGTSDPWRDRLMNHVKLRFGRNLSSAIDPQLRRTDLSGPARLGLLRMAGYISDPSLAETIEISWNADGNRQSHLADYLVTASYCCGDQPERILAPICDAWAALPSKAENENEPSAREDLAAHGVRFAFQRRPPLRAIKYLIKRANDEELRWPITYLLHEVDDPDVLEFIACELADTTISLEGSGRSSTFVITAPDRWSRHVEYGEKPMSKASKERLARLWSAPESGEHLRQQAFRLWAASQADGDIEILRRIEPDNSLWNKALFARLIRGDHLAIPAAEQKLLTNNESYWWQAGRYLWSARLTEALDQSLTRRRAEVERSWQQKERDVDWITSEMITRLPILTAESLLVKHWDHLRFSPNFIHAALHTATPVLAPLIANTMTECPDPSGALEHVDHHYGIGHRGRGVSRIAQVESLVPYLHLLSELAVLHFWDACNAQGWLTFRRTHLDPLLKNPRYSEFLTEDGMFASLDEQIERNHTRSIDWWVERFMKAGASIDEIMSILGKWLTSRSTMPAFTSVAEVVAQFGHRSHLSILNPQTVDPTDMAVDIVRDAEFTVRRRTLL